MAGVALTAQLAPALASVPPVRRAVWPRLAGLGPGDHVALTFDDGPDLSTSWFLDLLEEHAVTATFFLLGRYVAEHPDQVRRMQAAGHELAVHGWDHRCLALRAPGSLRADLDRTVDVIRETTGAQPCWYRPPYGVLTVEGLVAARRSGLEPVLWSSWGRDWERRTTPARIVAAVGRGRTRGGTVLLHDSDRTSAPGSWRRTLTATRILLDRWRRDGLAVGPLADHWPSPPAIPPPRRRVSCAASVPSPT